MRAAIPLLLAVAIGAPLTAHAADNDTEKRLREALRGATIQLRSIEDERATLLARQAETAKENEELRRNMEALTNELAGRSGSKKGEPDRAASERAAAELAQRLEQQKEATARLNETLEKWKAAYSEAAAVARAKEAERARLATLSQGLSQRAGRCEASNAELVKIGTEILDRYAAQSLGDVLGTREPFLGFKRVELQNQVQDYRDKLLDQKATP